MVLMDIIDYKKEQASKSGNPSQTDSAEDTQSGNTEPDSNCVEVAEQ